MSRNPPDPGSTPPIRSSPSLDVVAAIEQLLGPSDIEAAIRHEIAETPEEFPLDELCDHADFDALADELRPSFRVQARLRRIVYGRPVDEQLICAEAEWSLHACLRRPEQWFMLVDDPAPFLDVIAAAREIRASGAWRAVQSVVRRLELAADVADGVADPDLDMDDLL